jgi:hypothetical protein
VRRPISIAPSEERTLATSSSVAPQAKLGGSGILNPQREGPSGWDVWRRLAEPLARRRSPANRSTTTGMAGVDRARAQPIAICTPLSFVRTSLKAPWTSLGRGRSCGERVWLIV